MWLCVSVGDKENGNHTPSWPSTHPLFLIPADPHSRFSAWLALISSCSSETPPTSARLDALRPCCISITLTGSSCKVWQEGTKPCGCSRHRVEVSGERGAVTQCLCFSLDPGRAKVLESTILSFIFLNRRKHWVPREKELLGYNTGLANLNLATQSCKGRQIWVRLSMSE